MTRDMLEITFTDDEWAHGKKEIDDLSVAPRSGWEGHPVNVVLATLTDAALWQLDEKVAMILQERGYDLDYPPTNAYQGDTK